MDDEKFLLEELDQIYKGEIKFESNQEKNDRINEIRDKLKEIELK